uniref:Palmitoyltransferase n=1 Tax=Spongospora subterranea TaxID=70186 RepID=A0A0H5QHD2_9EUKA|eukprot:CRZ01420.1 hypothetical protein [Spongospora subterranea]
MQGPANGWHRSLRYAFSEFTIWMSSLDPFGAFCSSLTIILIVYSQYVTVYLIILSSSGLDYIHSLLYTACSIFALMSHFRAQFADPGFVPRHYIPQTMPQAQIFDGVRTSATILQAKKVSLPPVCRKCKTVKPKGAHHCSICTRCIARMDHHCPWINNCVAALNQKYFIQFLCWTGVLCLYSGSIIGAGIYRCAIDSDKCSDVSPNIIILVFLNLFEAVLFGCFVAVMLWDQLSAIFENTPYIDKLQVFYGTFLFLDSLYWNI